MHESTLAKAQSFVNNYFWAMFIARVSSSEPKASCGSLDRRLPSPQQIELQCALYTCLSSIRLLIRRFRLIRFRLSSPVKAAPFSN